MISDDRAKEIIEHSVLYGEKSALEIFGINAESLARYRRKYSNARLDALSKINERYNDEELEAISASTRNLISNVKITNFDGEKYVFGVGGDTHIGSDDYDPGWWRSAVEECKKREIKTFYLTGDITEGMSNRPGHIYECTHLGYKKQRDYAISELSLFDGEIYMIDGNHDRWFKKSNGAIIVEDICAANPNWHFLGQDEGKHIINGIDIRLWHGEDSSCFDDKTEILTKNGWIFFKDLSIIDEVATMTKDKHIFEWQQPLRIFKNKYKGELIHFKSKTVDCMVTPNHGMWARASLASTYKRLNKMKMPSKSHRRLNTEWHRKDAGEIFNDYGRQKWQFTKVSSDWNGNNIEFIEIPKRESKNKGKKVYHYEKKSIIDIVQLIAWYVTEGHASKYTIVISQYKNVNKKNYYSIKSLVSKLGGSFSCDDKSIVIHSAELSEWIKKECGHLSRNKYLPEWLKNCNKDILEIVLKIMIAGDGWRAGFCKDSYGYRSISKRLLNDFAEIAIKCGYSVRFQKDNETVGISKKQVYPTVNKKPEKINYDGMVYCCEVPNGLILVRRNGAILWTHNSYAVSYRIQKICEAFTGGEKPNLLLLGHVHKSTYLPERNIHCISTGTFQHQTKWMRGKRIPAHCGWWIVELTIKDAEIKTIKMEFFPFYQ